MSVEVQELHCDSPDTSFTSASAAGHPDPGKKINMWMCVFLLQDISEDIF